MISRHDRVHFGLALVAAVALAWMPVRVEAQAQAPTTLSVSGGSRGATQTVGTGSTGFGPLVVPLKPNAENVLAVTATDTDGRTARVENLSVLQIALTEIVRAQVTATRLTTQEVRQLVADGVIDVADPDNYNVSRFVIALVVGGEQVYIPVPVVRHKEAPSAIGEPVRVGCAAPGKGLSATDKAIAVPCGGSGGASRIPDFAIVPFEIRLPPSVPMPGIPGVIIIEGRIKTLKEFFKINLQLLNLSPIFTLSGLTAHLEFPAEALTGIAPAGGGIALPDIDPLSEANGQFIVRGDRIGRHTVTAHFGGVITGAFLPEPIPFSGSASTDLDVKGPPNLDVRVSHPNYVTAGVPYELTVEVTNTDDELDALYTSMEIDVGGDADLYDPELGESFPGPSVRGLGDILRGETIVQTYMVMPRVSGPIVSCVGAADANVKLSVAFTGRGGGPPCAIGTLPAEHMSSDGSPTVTVVPTHNTEGVSINPAIVAIFSQRMIEPTITTGHQTATFNVLTPDGGIVQGTLSFTELFEATAAIFRPTSLLALDTEYTIVVNPSVFSVEGMMLASGIVARFRTEGAAPAQDEQPPVVGLAFEAPYAEGVPVGRGQTPVVVATATDNIAVARVDLLLDGELIDAKVPNSPVRFLVDTSALTPGQSHVLTAVAYDKRGNNGSTTLTLQIAADDLPPIVSIVAESQIAQGQVLPITVAADDDGRVARVDLYLDSGETPVASKLVPPFQFAIDTTKLSLGVHVLRAVATDGAGNTAESAHIFATTGDTLAPVIAVRNPQTARFRLGGPVPFEVTAVDDVAVAGIAFLVDGTPVPSAGGSFMLDTTALAAGPHVVTVVATDTSGNASQVAIAFELFVPDPDAPPPAPVNRALVSVAAPSAGVVTVFGLGGAAAPQTSVLVINSATQAFTVVPVDAAGSFGAVLEASGGQVLALLVVDDAGNQSAAEVFDVPMPVSLLAVRVTPHTVELTRSHTSQQLMVVGEYSDDTEQVLTTGVIFTSAHPATATVTAGGLVLPGKNGVTSITVTVVVPSAGAGLPSTGPDDEVGHGTIVAAIDVPVSVDFSPIVGITASPNPLALPGPGQTQQIAVQSLFADGTTGPFNGAVKFATADATVAVVDNAGRVTSTGIGATTITTSNLAWPAVAVAVSVGDVVPDALIVEPASLAFTAAGQSEVLTVRVRLNTGQLVPPTAPVTFTSTNALVAIAASTGVVTAAATGSETIIVQMGAFVVDVPVTVDIPTTLPPPEITRLGRPIAGETDTLAIVGRHLSGEGAESLVTVNGLAAEVIGAAPTRLIVRVPRGATSGAVQVNVAGQLSNMETLEVYPRRAQVVLAGTPFDDTGGSAPAADFGAASFYYHVGDRVTLAGDANTIVGAQWSGLVRPEFAGTLLVTISSGEGVTQYDVTAQATAPIDLQSLMPSVSGPVSVAVRLERAGPSLSSRALSLIAGPDETGAFAGERYLPGDTVGQEVVLRFRVAVPDGTPFAATANAWYTTSGVWNNGSAGGAVVGGTTTPSGNGFRTLIAENGEVAVTYSDFGVAAPYGQAPPVAWIALVPVNATTGQRVGDTPVASAPIRIGVLHSASVIPEQPGLVADGVDRPMSVAINSVRDHYGNVVTEAPVALTANPWYRRDDGGWNNASRGGVVSGGNTTPGGSAFRTFTLTSGEAVAAYSVSGVTLSGGVVDTATLALVAATTSGGRQGERPFAEGRVTVSAPTISNASVTALPSSLTAASADHRSVVTISGITDALGQPVPDGMRVAVTATAWYRMEDGGWNNGSFGGTIIAGTVTPGGHGFRTFEVVDGTVTFTYSNAGLALDMGQTATTVLAVVPVGANGNRIGDRPVAEVRITQAGVTNATVVATPASTLADGVERPIAVAVTNITDAVGNLVPDGVRLALTATNWYRRSDGQWHNGSAGGSFVDGGPVSGGWGFSMYTVSAGRVDATLSTASVPPLAVGDARSSVIAVTVGSQTSNSRATERPFAEGIVAVSSVTTGTITVDPVHLVGDRQPRTATVSIEGLRDAQGIGVVDDTGVAITASQWYRLSDGMWHNSSAGGEMLGAVTTPGGWGFKTYQTQGGEVTATYSSVDVFAAPGQTTTAILSVVPVAGSGSRAGTRPFLIVPVTIAGVSGGTFIGPSSAAPASAVNVTLTGIRDALGNPVPDGALIAVTASQWYNLDNTWHNGSATGTVAGGTTTPGGSGFQTFTVSGGAITFAVTLPGNANVNTVVSAVSVGPNGSRNTNQPFAAFTIRVEN